MVNYHTIASILIASQARQWSLSLLARENETFRRRRDVELGRRNRPRRPLSVEIRIDKHEVIAFPPEPRLRSLNSYIP